MWAESTGKIAADLGEPAGRLYILAAAGVTAVLPAFTCDRCRQPLRLRSRSALDSIAKGGGTAECCARCNETLNKALQRLTDPAAIERRRQTRDQSRVRQERQEAARVAAQVRQAAAARWTAACGEIIRSQFPIEVAGERPVAWDELDSPRGCPGPCGN